jgi:hypothetical protein
VFIPVFEMVTNFELLKLELCLHFFRECYTFYSSCRGFLNLGNKFRCGILTFKVYFELNLLFVYKLVVRRLPASFRLPVPT